MVAKNFNRNQIAIGGRNNYIGQNNKKERPQCSHCGLLGYKIDKCYQVHGYPPGYKIRNKNPVIHGVANQVESAPDATSNLAQFPFTKNQYQQLLALIQPTDETHLPFTSTRTTNPQNPGTSGSQGHALANLAGPMLMDDDWSG
ncbi:unnamed protein product [Fraxinus pennsylvanica]|uniref:Uncharacterized protein n=1 Tax=Fraxinus pennsylvanica TaxID=56036 RepID=A0AAD2E3L5_9LAMI|nr:unnamed protein product [Fraxinus pennsylvanica]